jgi:hypothetical protein
MITKPNLNNIDKYEQIDKYNELKNKYQNDENFLAQLESLFDQFIHAVKEKQTPMTGGAADQPVAPQVAPITYDPTKPQQQPFFMPFMYQPEAKPEYAKRRVYKEKLGTCYYVPVTLQLHKGALSPEDVKKLKCHQKKLEMNSGINVLLGRPDTAAQADFQSEAEAKEVAAAKPPSTFTNIKNMIPSFGTKKEADVAAPVAPPAAAPVAPVIPPVAPPVVTKDVPHAPSERQNIAFGLKPKGGSRKKAKTHKRTKVVIEPDIINLLVYRGGGGSSVMQ